MAGAEANKQKKRMALAFAQTEAINLIQQFGGSGDFMLGLGLYWGEGVKAEQSTLAFVNSDPDSLVFMKYWFERYFKVTDEMFNPYIYITESHKERERKIISFWSHRLSLSKQQFQHVVYIKNGNKKVYENHDLYYGTVALRVRKSTNLKYSILALLEQTKADVAQLVRAQHS